MDAALEEAEALLGITADQLLTGGYYIETALNQPLQAIADALFADDGNFPDNASDGTPVQGALAVADTKTGALLALVGGRDYTTARGFNRATQMRRQPGSAIKPLAVYAPAIQAGYTAASIVLDEQEDFGGGYTPRNSGNLYYGNVTLRRALALSLNVATVRLMSEIGISRSTAFLEKTGIPLTDTDGNLSLALGSMTTGVTPAELAASYAMFGNQGVYNPPYIVTRIFAPTGEKLYEHEAAPRTVLSSQGRLSAHEHDALRHQLGHRRKACRRRGWPSRAKRGPSPSWAKAATAISGWPPIRAIFSLACWMGFDVTDANHHLPSRQSGGDATAAMATSFLKKAYANRQKPSFPEPEGLVWLTIDTIAGQVTGYPMLASSATPESYKLSEVFLASNRPWSTSNVWQSPSACSYFYVEFNDSGMPRLKFGCTDTALYRISRTVGGETVVLTELLGSAGESVSYVTGAPRRASGIPTASRPCRARCSPKASSLRAPPRARAYRRAMQADSSAARCANWLGFKASPPKKGCRVTQSPLPSRARLAHRAAPTAKGFFIRFGQPRAAPAAKPPLYTRSRVVQNGRLFANRWHFKRFPFILQSTEGNVCSLKFISTPPARNRKSS